MEKSDLFKHELIHQSVFIKTEAFTFSPAVRAACESNMCGRYARSWTCPPGAGTERELKERVLSYRDAFVFTYLGALEDSWDFEGMDAARKTAMGILGELRARLDAGKTKYYVMGCGSCALCAECTYPDSPCRFKELAVVSVEAHGIDVVKLAADTGINYYNGKNTVTYFCAVLF